MIARSHSRFALPIALSLVGGLALGACTRPNPDLIPDDEDLLTVRDGAATDAIIHHDAAPIHDLAVDQAMPIDQAAADMPAPVAVACGSSHCSGATPLCCSNSKGEAGGCLMSAGDCLDPVYVCDGPEDCPQDNVCCGGDHGSTCMSGGSCLTSGVGNRRFCHTDNDCTLTFPVCCSLGGNSPYKHCQATSCQ